MQDDLSQALKRLEVEQEQEAEIDERVAQLRADKILMEELAHLHPATLDAALEIIAEEQLRAEAALAQHRNIPPEDTIEEQL